MSGLWGGKSVFITPIIPRQTLLAFVMVEHPLGHYPSHKNQVQGACWAQHTGKEGFLFKCILCWVLEHLIVSNSNNLSQLKKINKKKLCSFLMQWQFCDIYLTSSFDHELKLGLRNPQTTFMYHSASTETGGLT